MVFDINFNFIPPRIPEKRGLDRLSDGQKSDLIRDQFSSNEVPNIKKENTLKKYTAFCSSVKRETVKIFPILLDRRLTRISKFFPFAHGSISKLKFIIHQCSAPIG